MKKKEEQIILTKCIGFIFTKEDLQHINYINEMLDEIVSFIDNNRIEIDDNEQGFDDDTIYLIQSVTPEWENTLTWWQELNDQINQIKLTLEQIV